MNDDQQARYHAALHAIQSGVAFEHGQGSPATTPKHLRVGINSALVEYDALVALLISKSVITEAEHAEARVLAAEREVARYEAHIKETYGIDVKLV